MGSGQHGGDRPGPRGAATSCVRPQERKALPAAVLEALRLAPPHR